MGKTAIAFKDLGKKCSDLLSKEYKVGKHTVEVKSKTANGVTFIPLVTKSGDSSTASLEAKYGFCGGESKATLSTTGAITASVEANDLLTKGLSLTLECEKPAPGKPGFLSAGTAIVDYASELLTGKASYDYYKGDAHAAVATVFKGASLGGSVDYNVNKSALTNYAAAAQYSQPDFTLCTKLAESVGKSTNYTMSYFHNVSGDMQVGAELSKKSSASEVALAFGCQYNLDKTTTVKAKVDSEGMLFGSYKQNISSVSTLTLCTQIDTVQLAADKHKFGLALNMNL